MAEPLTATRTDVNHETLSELYIAQKWSAKRVARHFQCDPNTVRKYLSFFGIPLRTRREAYACRPFTWSPARLRHNKRDFDGPLSFKAYLMGFRLGDLTVYQSSLGPNCRTIEVRGRTTQHAQIQLFRELFEPYGHIYQSRPDAHGGIHLIAYVNRSFDFLLPKQDAVEPWIQADPACALAFSAGYIDAEGSFNITITRTGLGKSVFAVATQDRQILQWMHGWLRSVGVPCPPPKLALRRGTPRMFSLNKDHWILQVARKASLVQLIGLLRPWIRHAKRKADMERVFANIKERNERSNFKYASRAHRAWASAITL